MIKPTKAELYAEVSKLEDKLIELECQLETAAIDAEKTVQQLLNQYNTITKITQERNELQDVNAVQAKNYLNLEAQLSKSIVAAAKEISELQDQACDLEKAIRMEREAGVAAFNRYADHLSKLRRQVNRANWYVATMFVATVAMACMAAVAIFVC